MLLKIQIAVYRSTISVCYLLNQNSQISLNERVIKKFATGRLGYWGFSIYSDNDVIMVDLGLNFLKK